MNLFRGNIPSFPSKRLSCLPLQKGYRFYRVRPRSSSWHSTNCPTKTIRSFKTISSRAIYYRQPATRHRSPTSFKDVSSPITPSKKSCYSANLDSDIRWFCICPRCICTARHKSTPRIFTMPHICWVRMNRGISSICKRDTEQYGTDCTAHPSHHAPERELSTVEGTFAAGLVVREENDSLVMGRQRCRKQVCHRGATVEQRQNTGKTDPAHYGPGLQILSDFLFGRRDARLPSVGGRHARYSSRPQLPTVLTEDRREDTRLRPAPDADYFTSERRTEIP